MPPFATAASSFLGGGQDGPASAVGDAIKSPTSESGDAESGNSTLGNVSIGGIGSSPGGVPIWAWVGGAALVAFVLWRR